MVDRVGAVTAERPRVSRRAASASDDDAEETLSAGGPAPNFVEDMTVAASLARAALLAASEGDWAGYTQVRRWEREWSASTTHWHGSGGGEANFSPIAWVI